MNFLKMQLFTIHYKDSKNPQPIGYIIDPSCTKTADQALRYWWDTQDKVDYEFAAYKVLQANSNTISIIDFK